jgi:hypothetical protein
LSQKIVNVHFSYHLLSIPHKSVLITSALSFAVVAIFVKLHEKNKRKIRMKEQKEKKARKHQQNIITITFITPLKV